MTIRSIRRFWCVLAIACVSLVNGCAQDKKYEGIAVSAKQSGQDSLYLQRHRLTGFWRPRSRPESHQSDADRLSAGSTGFDIRQRVPLSN